jgi:hypothetical protein
MGLAPDHRDRGFGIERHQLQARSCVLDQVIDRIAPTPADDLVEILRAQQYALGSLITAAPVDRRHRLHDRVRRIDRGHGPQDRDRGERVGRAHLEQVDRLDQRAVSDRLDRDARRIARQDVDQPRREGPNEALAAGEILLRHPFVQRARIREVLLDLGHQPLPVERHRRIVRLIGDDLTRQDMRAAHPVDAFLENFVPWIANPLAGLDQEVDDLG